MSRSCEQRHVFRPENGAGPQTLLNIMKLNKFAAFAALGFFALTSFPTQAAVSGWTNWRGPHQNGVTDEKGLPDQIDPAKNLLWSYDIAGRGAPVIANGNVYAWGDRKSVV